jgi:flagellar hook protein FlgE
MPSFYIPISGLNADSTALDTIANNLSNMNTTGFKEQTTQFSNLFSQTIGTAGSGDAIQVGSGVQVAANTSDFSGGSISSTGISTDNAINGSGFFVLDGGAGSQLYTRDGNFQTSSTGLLQASSGQAVMGYPAVNGVINTSGGLTDITLPTGQVMQPAATTTFSMTQNLDASASAGTVVAGQVKVYDSLGKSYEATVTYTAQGGNKWSYNVTLPDTLSATPISAAAAQKNLPVTSSPASASTVTSPLTPTYVAGTGVQTYTFGSSSGILGPGETSGTLATVNPNTNLIISGLKADGVTPASTSLPTISAGETVATYAAALTTAMATAGIANVTATSTGNTLVITGPAGSATPPVSAGTLQQDLGGASVNFDLGSSATVNPSTNLQITGLNAAGATVTTVIPPPTANESVANYLTSIQTALGPVAGGGVAMVGVSVASNAAGQITITGANFTTTGGVAQDEQAQTVSYNFGSNNAALATVDPGTNLTITGPTPAGGTATTTAPTLTAGETVTQYAAALNASIAAAGIGGVVATVNNGQLNINGTGMTLNGTVMQDPAGSANQAGTLAFDSNGNLVSPGSNVSGMTFGGLSDGATTMTLNWGLFGANGTANISQTDAASTTASTNQNGYPSGQYQSFAVDNSGVVTATYSNGQTNQVGQIAVATVTNEQGLQSVGSTNYTATTASGAASVGVAGNGGRGTITGSSLEASNVNISAEFSALIVAQRAFEANSKAVTTFDSVTQETINMIH